MSSNYNLESGNVLIAVGGKYTLNDGTILKVIQYIHCLIYKSMTLCRPKSTIMDRSVSAMPRISGKQKCLKVFDSRFLIFRNGVRLCMSTLIEAYNINAGGHKLGLSLDFES